MSSSRTGRARLRRPVPNEPRLGEHPALIGTRCQLDDSLTFADALVVSYARRICFLCGCILARQARGCKFGIVFTSVRISLVATDTVNAQEHMSANGRCLPCGWRIVFGQLRGERVAQTSGDSRKRRAPEAGPEPIVYVVDDDDEAREYVSWLLTSAGWSVKSFDCAQDFLDGYDPALPGCLVSDVRMPGLSGLDLQRALTERSIRLPIIMMSAFAEVPMAVRAMREGAVDFLEKPFDGQTLVERVRKAVATNRRDREDEVARKDVAAGLAKLTPRQLAVLEGLIAGKPSKVIAADLGVSPRTVDVHRFRLMHQLNAQSLPDLFRRVLLVRGGSPS